MHPSAVSRQSDTITNTGRQRSNQLSLPKHGKDNKTYFGSDNTNVPMMYEVETKLKRSHSFHVPLSHILCASNVARSPS
eukprot:8088885-Heterocapsa_arctica.AAC.1